jgi:hypothetical protein
MAVENYSQRKKSIVARAQFDMNVLKISNRGWWTFSIILTCGHWSDVQRLKSLVTLRFTPRLK